MSEPAADRPTDRLWPSSGSIEEFEVTIVMPCLNEAETLETCIVKATAAIRDNNLRGEVLIADNGSTDGSQLIAERLGARVVPVVQKGYGAALQGGIEAARSRYVIMGDADDSYDFGHLPRFVEKLRDGYDLVMGNRFQGGVKSGAMPWKNRYIGNPVLTTVGRLFFGSPAGDFHCGLRGFAKSSYQRMGLQTTGMEFASEMVIKATLLDMRIAEVPTTLRPDGRSRPPHLRPWRDGWRHLRFMLLFSPRWLFFYPGVVLMFVGMLITTVLAFGARSILGLTFDIHTMLYGMVFMLVGFQAVFFSMVSRVFAITEGFHPMDQRLARWFDRITLEWGLVVGVLLFVLGVAGTLFALLFWREQGWGRLNPGQVMRIAIPSAGFVALGVQVIMSSFLLSVLGIRRR